MYEYWISLTIEERKEFLTSIYILPELADREFYKLPANTRTMLYGYYNNKLKK